MTCGCYVTGTDTGVGKSLASAALLAALAARGVRAVGMKPVASGCRATPQGLRSADARLLVAHSAGAPAYADVNPYAFAAPVAPHIAAADAGVSIDPARIVAAHARLAARASCCIVEGVGGWLAPLGPALWQGDLAKALRLPVILVVGLRLGCLNHALLTARAVVADGCQFAGWIANRIDPRLRRAQDNLAALRRHLPGPCLGVLPQSRARDPAALARHLGRACERLTGGGPAAQNLP